VTVSIKTKLDHELKRKGFGGLDDPRLIQQIAFCVRDHVHLRQILVTVVPEKRTQAYEAMRPYLRFEAKPLDVYIAEAADLAARKEQDQTKIDVIAEKAIARAEREWQSNGKRLILVCVKCTRQEDFPASERFIAAGDAYREGWRKDDGKVYCKTCAPKIVIE